MASASSAVIRESRSMQLAREAGGEAAKAKCANRGNDGEAGKSQKSSVVYENGAAKAASCNSSCCDFSETAVKGERCHPALLSTRRRVM